MDRINRTLLRRGRLSANDLLQHPALKTTARRKKLKLPVEPKVKRTCRRLDLDLCYKIAFLRYGSLTDFANTNMTVAEISK